MKKILAIAFVIAVVATAVITMRSTRIPPPVVAHQIATGSVGDVNLPPPGKTSPIISNILQQPNRALPPSQIPRLSLSEEQKLIEAYRQIKLPSARLGITVALAFGGGDAAAEVFRFSLRSDSDEWRYLSLH